MNSERDTSVEDRILQLLDQLGIVEAHFVTGTLGDLSGLAKKRPELFSSLTLVCPGPPDPDAISPLASRLLVFRGDSPDWDGLGQLIEDLPGASLKTLHNWEAWSDLVTDHEPEISAALLPFLAMNTADDMADIAHVENNRGQVAGIHYQIQGAGRPLVLLPIGFAPSQWDAIIPILTSEYSTIILGGPELGVTALLEKRAREPGYLGMVRTLIQEAQLKPGDSVLEVGCGTGALGRWLARYTNQSNPISGIDLNRFLLREATNLARFEGLDGHLVFKEGNAEALTYPDDSYDLVMSVTLLEEVDADKALAEMVRVAKPGGRVAAIVRAIDMPFFINLPLPETLKEKVEDPKVWGTKGRHGCADISLYQKFLQSILTDVKIYPHLAAFIQPWAVEYVIQNIQPILDEAELVEWQAALELSDSEGTFIWSYPHHCAIGTKPG